jgi:hypothetical protein
MSAPAENWNAKARHAVHTHLWLILSLVVNVFLLVILYAATRPLGIPTVPPSSLENGTLVRTNVLVRHENFTWDQIESTNYEMFVKNLRAVGCPEQTIRDIIVSEVDRIYAHRRLNEVDYPNFQWWKADPDPDVLQSAAQRIQQLDAERRSILNGLLGQGWETSNNEQVCAAAGITLTGPVLGDLPQDIKDSVYAALARTQGKIARYELDQREKSKAVDPMEIVRLREEPLTQVASLLNAKQYEEFALRYTPAAEQLREQFRSQDLTPDQFRTLFIAINAVNGQPAFFYNGTDQAMLKQQQELRNQCDAIIKTTLGEQFYASYELSQDPLYRSSKAMAEQLGVPLTSVSSIYDINRATQSELDRIRKDANMTSDEKVEAISQARVEQQQSLEQVLGPEAFSRWLQTHSGMQ